MASTVTHADVRSQFLSFELCGEEYAVNILRVKEILEYDALTRVPAMPDCVRGVINLRGRVVPVVDLAALFGLGESSITRRSCIVMVEFTRGNDAVVMGVITDAVSQVLELAESTIQPPPLFGTRVSTDCIQGMSESGKKFVIILNMDRALHAVDFVGETVAAA